MHLPSGRELGKGFANLCSTNRGQADFLIGGRLGPGFWGRSRDGLAVALFPLERRVQHAAVQFQGLRFEPLGPQDIRLEEYRETLPVAVLKCLDAELIQVFSTVARDIATALHREPGEGPLAWSKVRDAVARWRRLFGRARRLSPERELGLWGELELMLRAPNVALACETWTGPSKNPLDFVGGGIGIECKTSRMGHVHWVSQSQVDEPGGDYPSYVASLWVSNDAVKGRTLPDQVNRVMARFDDDTGFLAALIEYGYSPKEHATFSSRYAVRQGPFWFASNQIPRVRSMDDGVMMLRYQVDLSALEPLVNGDQMLERLVGLHEGEKE